LHFFTFFNAHDSQVWSFLWNCWVLSYSFHSSWGVRLIVLSFFLMEKLMFLSD
jgi:hypothetical protein